ncbi:MAG: S-layer homology domain-containing protein, partial [Clostridiales Family XIII bacterium]|nr:S-layer homology domain-containing protein [Clostridiales Family XIII bacterium]
MRKILAIATSVALFVPAAVFGASFSDLPDTHWAYNAIAAMSEKGIVSGYPDGAFKPSGTVTYGEFIKMAYIAQGGE